MMDFFQYDTDDNRRSLLARARKVALSALQQYDLQWERIQFIQLSDTITYKIKTSSGEIFLLRIHSARLSKGEIASELIFLQALNKLGELHVPEGLANRDGTYVLEVETEEGYRRPYVTMMRWVEGEHVSGKLTDTCIYNVGVMMGRLHHLAARFTPPVDFIRSEWGADSFRSEFAELERYHTRFLSNDAWNSYKAAAKKICSELAAMEHSGDTYGLIHGDLHRGNIVFKDDQPYPIDFGRCGYGYYLYDMAGLILGLFPAQRGMLIQGYESVRKLEPNYVRYLECFFIMSMIENYCHHASDPRETSSLIEEQPYAQACIREYLSDHSFLFEVIEPVNPG